MTSENKEEKCCVCKTKYCKHYKSDFDKFVENNTPQTPSWEDKVDYFFKFQSVNHYPEDKNKLIEELELTINSLISQTKQEGRREGIEEAILEIIYGCARYTNMHQDTDDVNVAVNTVRADVLSKLDKKRK